MAAKKSTPSTKLAKREPEALPAIPISVTDLMQDGASQQFERNDLTIPFLKVLQDMSPVAKKRDPAFVKGAEPGFFFNTVTQRLTPGDEGVVVIPVAYQRSYTEWNKLEDGGGLVKDHGADGSLLVASKKDERGRLITPDGTELVEAALYYVMELHQDSPGEYSTAAFLLKGTQWKKARAWNSRMDGMKIEMEGQRFKPAMFYHAWRLKTVPEQNDQGSWYGVSVELEAPVFELEGGALLYDAAKDFAKVVTRGQVKVKHDSELDERRGEEDDDSF